MGNTTALVSELNSRKSNQQRLYNRIGRALDAAKDRILNEFLFYLIPPRPVLEAPCAPYPYYNVTQENLGRWVGGGVVNSANLYRFWKLRRIPFPDCAPLLPLATYWFPRFFFSSFAV